MDHPEGPPILLGDSIFRRLYERNTAIFHTASSKFCIGGQTVAQLYALIKEHRDILKGRRVFVLIGANDILKSVSVDSVQKSLRSVVRVLRRLKCEIILCELLPIPKFGASASSSPSVLLVNNFIKSFEPSGVQVVHTFKLFCSESLIRLSLFCKFIGDKRRVDLVHPNSAGLDCLLLTLELAA